MKELPRTRDSSDDSDEEEDEDEEEEEEERSGINEGGAPRVGEASAISIRHKACLVGGWRMAVSIYCWAVAVYSLLPTMGWASVAAVLVVAGAATGHAARPGVALTCSASAGGCGVGASPAALLHGYGGGALGGGAEGEEGLGGALHGNRL